MHDSGQAESHLLSREQTLKNYVHSFNDMKSMSNPSPKKAKIRYYSTRHFTSEKTEGQRGLMARRTASFLPRSLWLQS